MKPTTLVTGAGSGIGRSIALRLARRGVRVFGVALGEDELARLRAEVDAPIETLALDLTLPDSPAALVEHAASRDLLVEGLVNCAGMGLFGEHLALDEVAVARMISLNVTALTTLTTLFARAMRARGHGRIVNIASTAAFQPCPKLAAYAATKHYVAAFTFALAEELRGTGVSVSLMCPGITNTPFIESSGVPGGSRTDRAARAVAMTPDQVAEAVVGALEHGDPFVVAGAFNRAHYALSRTLPQRTLSRVFDRVTRLTS